LTFTKVAGRELLREVLDPTDVFLVDTGKELFVWVGGKASPEEKQNGLAYAHKYLMTTKHPLVSVTCLRQGKESIAFKKTMN
uniref:hypothetical protein n=1 Tax=Salmonella sp. s51944 TaxID=3159655 RepID=UPI00397F68AB